MYILNKNCSLRGWKNLPCAIVVEGMFRPPAAISEELMRKLSKAFDYQPGEDKLIDLMVRERILVPCQEDSDLMDGQKYHNYGCLHFDSVIFSITGRCNYKCMHCSVNAPNSPMTEIPYEKICGLLDEMKECGLNNIVLIGGEPLIRNDFLRIVDEIRKRQMHVSEIFTNASLVTSDLLDELDHRNVHPLFMISFDGVGFHDKMRGVKGAEENFFQKVILLRKRDFPVSCNMCITRESICSIWDTIQKLSDLGVNSLTVYPPVECGLWEDKAKTMGVTTEMIGEIYPDVIEKYVAAGYPLDLNLYGLAFFSKSLKKYSITPKWRTWGNDPSQATVCQTFHSELNISPEGILSPCYALMSDPYVRENMPDLSKMSLKQALTDSSFTRIMELTNADIQQHNPKCRECQYLSVCGGGCRLSAYKKTGDFLGYDPQMCLFFEEGFDKKFREAIRRGHQKRFNRALGF